MAAAVPATEIQVVEQPSWVIESDAFAPPPTRRLVRGWDRAPVAARAPRLQGQKVWKKVGVKLAHVEDEHDEVQEELLKEGGGARKRARAMGARENICNAVWADARHTTTKDIMTYFDQDENGLESQNEINTTSRSSTLRTKQSTHPEVDYVPRKRTHADHVITPKRFPREAAVNKNAQIQPLAEITNITPIQKSRARKSLRKSSLGLGEETPGNRKPRSQPQISGVVQQTRDVEIAASTVVENNEDTPVANPSQRYLRRSTTAKSRSTGSVGLVTKADKRRSEKQSRLLIEKFSALTTEKSASNISQVPVESTLLNEVGSSRHEDGSHVTGTTTDLASNVSSEINSSADLPEHIELNVQGRSFDDMAVSSEDTAAEDTTAEDTTVKKTAPEDTSAEDTTVKKTAPKDTANEDTAPEDTTLEDTALEDTALEDTAAENVVSEEETHEVTPEESSQEEVPQVTTAEHMITSSTFAEMVMAEEAAAEDAAPENTAAEKVASSITSSEDMVAEPAVTEEMATEEKIAKVTPEKHLEVILESSALTPEAIISNCSEQPNESPVLADTSKPTLSGVSTESLQPSDTATKQPIIANLERQTSSNGNTSPTCSTHTSSEHGHLELESASTEVSVCGDDTADSVAGPDTSKQNELAPGHDHTTVLIEAQSATGPVLAYDHDDTDMLRNFLTRVKANKAAKNPPRRKRSLPHSPLQIPLGNLDNNVSPSPQKPSGGSDTTQASPSKRRKKGSPVIQDEEPSEPKSCRRSARTRIPPKDPPGAPSFIPVRRLGQEPDNTVNLRRNEEKELAALTRVNTRKNKGVAVPAPQVLAMKAEEKDNPALRQRLLKEVFDEKMDKNRSGKDKKGRDKKAVSWAEELTQFQTSSKGKVVEEKDVTEEVENGTEKKAAMGGNGEEKKKGAVRLGVRSKAALGMAMNGTPAPKRKMRGRG